MRFCFIFIKDLFEFYLAKLENNFFRKFKTCELSKSFVNVEIINNNKSHYTVGILGVYLQLGES